MGPGQEEETAGIRRRANPARLRRRSSVSRIHEGHSRAVLEATDQYPRPTDGQESQSPATPLLIAPPTPSASIAYEGDQGWSNWICYQLPPVSELLTISFWLGLFLAKMLALARPCLPFMFNLAAGLPFVVLAALDLGVTLTRQSDGTSHEGSLNRRLPERRVDWSPRTSLVLLGLHFVVVGVMNWFEVLCSPPPDGLQTW